MKRMVSLFLTAALAAGLALPAAAAEDTADARLAQVTQAVKDTLDLDTSQYDTFYGDCFDQVQASQWSLYWEGSTGSLSIDALEDGTILWYDLNLEESYSDPGLPSYPQGGDPASAKEAAQAFLDKVLRPGVESVELGEPDGGETLGESDCSFSGNLLFYGLPSPLSFFITVDRESNQVVRFSRDPAYSAYFGEIPAAAPGVEQDEAAQALKSALSLSLEYVLPEEGSTQAVLRYARSLQDEYYVDAQTGELVNLSQLRREMAGIGMGGGDASEDSSAESAPGASNGLSQAEQEGIQKLEGVLSGEELDRQLRTQEAYGLEDYTLIAASYRLVEGTDGVEDTVQCTLRYQFPQEEGTASRTFTVDAKSGQVERLWSYLPWDQEQRPALTQDQAQARAEEFLQDFCPDRISHLALAEVPEDAEGESGSYSFLFERQENGYFFPEHFYGVSISARDGSVCGLSYVYDESVTFAPPEGLISEQEALDAWMDTYTVTLGYLQVPEKLDAGDPEAAPYLQMGMEDFYRLKLGYSLEREDDFSYLGVDAQTGAVVRQEERQTQLTYQDLSGHWAREAIESLAAYGVGYEGETFAPDQAMTQWDLVALLYSVTYYPLDPAAATQEERSGAYAAAYRLGALTARERQDDAPLTRSQAVQLLLNAQGLREAAGLAGIYTCSYTDRDSIPAEEMGYAALAQGIGMVQGTWAGSRTATRAEGAVMLHKLLGW